MYRIEITARARDDADAAHAWMVENISPAYAEEWYRGLFQRIETLTRQPARCPVAPESREFPGVLLSIQYSRLPRLWLPKAQ